MTRTGYRELDEQHPLTVEYGNAKPRPLSGPDRPLQLDSDPGRWPHPSTLTFDQALQVGKAPTWVREVLAAELAAWHGAEDLRLSAEHDRLVREAANEGRGRVVVSSEASRKRQQVRHHADSWTSRLNVTVPGVAEMWMRTGE